MEPKEDERMFLLALTVFYAGAAISVVASVPSTEHNPTSAFHAKITLPRQKKNENRSRDIYHSNQHVIRLTRSVSIAVNIYQVNSNSNSKLET
jgi:hypothetical protein